jgi:hypothetical protein
MIILSSPVHEVMDPTTFLLTRIGDNVACLQTVQTSFTTIRLHYNNCACLKSMQGLRCTIRLTHQK